MGNLDSEKIVQAIKKGADYLFLQQNPDGGIKYQDEKSIKSGIWVTAEALEFFLSSKNVHMTAYEKVSRMLDFIIKTQDKDGAWSVIPNDEGVTDSNALSAITTGHCVYVLKMSLACEYIENNKRVRGLRNAIRKGELWLRNNRKETDGVCYWGTDSSEPNGDLGQRMECVFTTYYAVKGFLNPDDYKEDNKVDSIIISKTVSFFNQQADFFINEYASKIDSLKFGDFAKISSTICRIARGLFYLGDKLSQNRRDGLKKLLESCSKNPFMTSSIRVSDNLAKQYTATYNNNTPFDMAIALIILETNIIAISKILDEYINQQDSEGFWYLNFSNAYDVKTWSTAEALLVLEKALDKYNYIALENEKKCIEEEKSQTLQQIKNLEDKNTSLEDKNTSLKVYASIAIIISSVLSIVGIVVILRWLNVTPKENRDGIWGSILELIVIPLIVNLLSNIWVFFKNIIEVNILNKHKK